MTPRQRYESVRHLMPDADMTLIGDEIKWLDDRPMPSDVDIEAAHHDRLLSVARNNATERIKAGYRQALSTLKSGYLDEEIEGWREQITAAKAHQAGGTSDFIAKMATKRGISQSGMAERILAKREDYLPLYAEATGTLGRLRDEINIAYEAGNIRELEAINWPE